MIENEQQYEITQWTLAKFQGTVNALKLRTDLDPVMAKAQCEALESMIEEFKRDIRDYQNGFVPQGEGYGLIGVWRNLKHAVGEILRPPPYEDRHRQWRRK